MTRAPDNLLAVRRLLLKHLDIDPTRARSIDLESAEVGIVGDTAHIAEGDSYHLGTPEQSRNGSYSVGESSRDRDGLSEYASALDVGTFEVNVAGRTYDLPHFSAWCVGQCKANATDARDLREIIWSPDGRTVKRWDRLGIRSTGDGSHRYHTHFSFFRDSTRAGRDQTPLFRRYLTTIGLLEDDDMTPEELRDADVFPNGYGDAAKNPAITFGTFVRNVGRDTEAARKELEDLRTKVGELAGRPAVAVDYDQLADALLRRVLTPAAPTQT